MLGDIIVDFRSSLVELSILDASNCNVSLKIVDLLDMVCNLLDPFEIKVGWINWLL